MFKVLDILKVWVYLYVCFCFVVFEYVVKVVFLCYFGGLSGMKIDVGFVKYLEDLCWISCVKVCWFFGIDVEFGG